MSTDKFSKWRSFLWPIHHSELRKFIPMFFIFFFIAFNYNILRSYKDTILVTASHSGAEVIPFIKLWVVLPSAILFTLLFTHLSNRFRREQVFYIIMSIFLIFFFLFASVLYPYREILHPHEVADWLTQKLPTGFKGLIAIYRNWTFSFFYVMSELWSTTIFTVLFWGFANEVTTVSEAKRYYGLLTFGGNIAGVFAGFGAISFSKKGMIPWISYGQTSWDQSIFFVCTTIIVVGLLTIGVFRWLNVNIIGPQEDRIVTPRTKVKMSMRNNFAYLARSKYLLYIALIVFTYNLAINLVEVVWKDQMKALYPDSSDYNSYMAQVMIAMAIVASVAGLFTTSKMIQRFSWSTCAIIPTVVIAITGLPFFFFAYFPESIPQWMGEFFQMTPLMLCVSLGSIQNCLARASKYTLFDATKEIAFIPLSSESKLKGKAAIDGVGSRFGKSGGSIIFQGLILFVSSVAASIPYVAVIFMIVILIWALSVVSLGKQFDRLIAENATIRIPDTDLTLSHKSF